MVDVAGLHGFFNADMSSILSINRSEAARRISWAMAHWLHYPLNMSLSVTQRLKNSMCGPRRAYIHNGRELVKPFLELTTSLCMREITSLPLANLFHRQENEAIRFSMLSTLLKFNTRMTV